MTISDLSYENNKRNYLGIVLSIGLLLMNFPNISEKKRTKHPNQITFLKAQY